MRTTQYPDRVVVHSPPRNATERAVLKKALINSNGFVFLNQTFDAPVGIKAGMMMNIIINGYSGSGDVVVLLRKLIQQ